MRKYFFNSLSAFYADIKNVAGHKLFDYSLRRDREYFTGLKLDEINRCKFTYQPGVEKIRQMAEVKVEKDVKVRYYDQFDGFDINIDRMIDGLDFLVNERKVRKLPRTIDLLLNITEAGGVNYENMLSKTYATLRIADHLESLGVRVAVYVCCPVTPIYHKGKGQPFYLEICVKKYADPVNLGALCTSISPWFLRHWVFAWIIGRDARIDIERVGLVTPMPASERRGILIDTGQCYSTSEANAFISNIKITPPELIS